MFILLHCPACIANGHQVLQASSAVQLVANHAWSTIAWPLSDLAFSTGEAKSKLALPHHSNPSWLLFAQDAISTSSVRIQPAWVQGILEGTEGNILA